MQFSSMRARVTAIFALIVATLMVVGSVLVLRLERRLAEDRVRETLSIALVRAKSEMTDVKENEQRTLFEVVREYQGEIAAGGLVLFVTDANNQLIWRSRAIQYPLDTEHWRSQKLNWGNQNLILASDFSKDEVELRDTALALVGLGLFVIVTTSTTAWFLVGKTLSPIQKLAFQAHVATDTLSVRLNTPSSDAEMKHLTATLNDLLGRLQRDAQSRGRFYAAASHELRTPLQALLGHLDVALSRKRAAADYETALLEAQNHTERLTTLVQDLLQLNALEMGATAATRENIDLAGFVMETLFIVEKTRVERDLKIEINLENVEIEAPSVHLEMMLRNLLENAVKYAKNSTSVEITVEKAEESAVFRIWNPCDSSLQIGSGQDLSAWFEPFFRLDASRNSLTGGNGLGLAICDSIARANNWNITLESKNGGVLAAVFFPLSPFSTSSTPAISQQIP